MNFLLDIVSDDGKPDYTVSVGSNLSKILEEHGDLLLLTLIIGIVFGIMLSYACYHIYKLFAKSKSEKESTHEEDNQSQK